MLFVAAGCWGAAAPLTKYGLSGLNVLGLLVIQLLAAAAALWGVVAVRGYRRVPIGRVVALGLIEPATTSVLFTAGIAHTSAASGSLVSALEGVLVALAGLIALREGMGRGNWVALGVSVPGVWLLEEAGMSSAQGAGTLLIVMSAAAAAVYSVLAARIVRDDHDPITVTAVQFLSGAAVILVGVAVGHRLLAPAFAAPSALHLAAAAGSGVIGLALPFCLYNRAIAVVPVGEAGLLLTLTPVAGVAMSMMVLGEDVTARQALGGILIVGAVAILSWPAGHRHSAGQGGVSAVARN
jgi:drug/metabolite transporter (DMT)-like permease